jgi:hypothetical protein
MTGLSPAHPDRTAIIKPSPRRAILDVDLGAGGEILAVAGVSFLAAI